MQASGVVPDPEDVAPLVDVPPPDDVVFVPPPDEELFEEPPLDALSPPLLPPSELVPTSPVWEPVDEPLEHAATSAPTAKIQVFRAMLAAPCRPSYERSACKSTRRLFLWQDVSRITNNTHTIG
jgi:hypothetical protein